MGAMLPVEGGADCSKQHRGVKAATTARDVHGLSQVAVLQYTDAQPWGSVDERASPLIHQHYHCGGAIEKALFVLNDLAMNVGVHRVALHALVIPLAGKGDLGDGVERNLRVDSLATRSLVTLVMADVVAAIIGHIGKQPYRHVRVMILVVVAERFRGQIGATPEENDHFHGYRGSAVRDMKKMQDNVFPACKNSPQP